MPASCSRGSCCGAAPACSTPRRTPCRRHSAAASARRAASAGRAASAHSSDSRRAAPGAACRRRATSAANPGAASRGQRHVDGARAAVGGDGLQRQVERGQVDLGHQAAAAGQRQPARRRLEFASGLELHPQRALQVDAGRRPAPAPGIRPAACARPPARRRSASRQARAPAGSAARPARPSTARPSPASARASAASASASAAPAATPARPSAAPTATSAPPARSAGAAASVRVDRRRGLGGHAGHRQAEAEVAAVQAPGQRAGHALDIGLQHVGDGAQHAVGGLVAQPRVQRLELRARAPGPAPTPGAPALAQPVAAAGRRSAGAAAGR